MVHAASNAVGGARAGGKGCAHVITTLHGDCTELLPTLPPASIQCIVTSPPYFGLRDYGLLPTHWPAIEYVPMAGLPPIAIPSATCCLGLEDDPLAYIGHLVHVFRLARPALRSDGTAWLNLGDSYAQDSKWGGRSGGKNYTSAAGGISRERKRTGLKDKNLMMIPARAALALQADGWYVRSDVIWAKPNAMPESIKDRPTRAHEYLFLLAKHERYFYDQAAVAEPLSAPSKFAGNRAQQVAATGGIISGGTSTHTHEITARNRRSVWCVPTQALRDEHYAPWPDALVEPCIRAGSSAQACEHCGAAWVRVVERESNWQERKAAGATAGNVGVSDTYQNGVHDKNMSHDLKPKAVRVLGFQPACACEDNTGSAASVVLDMFAGSGTTLRVAERLQRNSIGIDLNADYLDIQARRTNGVQVELFV